MPCYCDCLHAYSVPGGSAANVLKGISNISRGGVQCKFAGMVGDDDTGKQYRYSAPLRCYVQTYKCRKNKG